MRDLVAIPTFSRPEMLWHCLERLQACPEWGSLDACVFVDNHLRRPPPLGEIAQVMAKFPGVPFVLRPETPYRGNSYNVLSAYVQAWREERERVYLVEDDVMVEPDFFRWHREALEPEATRPFCSIGVTQRGPGYCSLGVCFPRESLELIVPHASPDYFGNMSGYCAHHFRDGRSLGTEQDGLILRIMLQARKKARYSDLPRARHVGWYGYNRGLHAAPAGGLAARYQAVAARVGQDIS